VPVGPLAYSRLPGHEVPLALRELHQRLEVGTAVRLAFRGRDGDGDGPGWSRELLGAVVEGAGFGVESLRRGPRGDGRLHVRARRLRTIADTVGPGMRMLLVGLNPSLVAADAGVGFHRAGNRAWPALLRAGLATRDRDPVDLLVRHRIGMTDLVKRATPRAAEITRDEYRHGLERLGLLCGWLRPGVVCVLGVTGWRHAADPDAQLGPQASRLGGCPVHVVPNPSGANAHVTLEAMAEHLLAAFHGAREEGFRETGGRAPP